MPIKICAVTSTRADYGILTPLLKKLSSDPYFHLTVVATGTHLLDEFGHTVDDIVSDGFTPVEIPILLDGEDDAVSISDAMAEALRLFSRFFFRESFDLLLVLGDRYEMVAVCCAAVNCRLPIAHLHGGETTKGAIDECYRHAITKMSRLHFPATEVYRRRIIQMGEQPECVFNVGALAVENILSIVPYSQEQLSKEVGMMLEPNKYAMVTFHPVTQEKGTASTQVRELMEAMDARSDLKYLVTKANADEGGRQINKLWDAYSAKQENVCVVESLGMRRYLSAMRASRMVLGNSSSGILEAPICGVPTVNIGDRQAGRLRCPSIVDCEPNKESILSAMRKAERLSMIANGALHLYGQGDTSARIFRILKEQTKQPVNLKKVFYDIRMGQGKDNLC